jgi:hypothetical protein
MIRLHIRFPDNIIADEVIKQKHIPCFCKYRGELEVSFNSPLPEAIGKVDGLSMTDLSDRASAGAGGHYIFFEFGMITLRMIEKEVFDVVDLLFFDGTEGWRTIVENGELAPPLERHTQEERDAFNALFPPLRKKKHR